MTSNEIKERLRTVLQNSDVIESNIDIIRLFFASYRGIIDKLGTGAHGTGLLKQENYKWLLVESELTKEGIDVPKNLFIYLIKMIGGEDFKGLFKRLGWDNVRHDDDRLTGLRNTYKELVIMASNGIVK